MEKQLWVLIGVVAVASLAFAGRGISPSTPNEKLTADLMTNVGTPSAMAPTSTLAACAPLVTSGTAPAASATPPSTAPVCSLDLNSLTTAIVAALTAVTDTSTSTASSPPAPVDTTPLPPKIPQYQYRYLTNADECVLNRFGTQGWTVLQVGSIVTDNNGGPYYAADCRTAIRGYVDWAFLVKSPAAAQ